MRTAQLTPRALMFAGALVIAASPAAAQSAPLRQPSTPTPPLVTTVDLSTVRRDIKAILTAQEKYYTTHNSYSLDLAALDYSPSEGVTVKLVEASRNAYSVSGIVAGEATSSCVMYVGRVSAFPKTAKGVAAKDEGGVLCDGDPPAI